MRYIKITLFIGFVVSLLVAGIYEAGFLSRLDVSLWSFLGRISAHPHKQPIVQYFVFVFLAFGIAWTTVDINRPSLKILVAAGALIEILMLPWVLNFHGVFFSPFPGAIATLGSFALGFAYSRSDAGKRKRTLRNVLGLRLSRKSFSALLDAKAPLNFEGELRETSIVVCEIFNHDALAEALPVADYVAMTNRFLETGAEFFVETGGYLDECDGESLRVIYGAPIHDVKHSAKACEAALAMEAQLDKLNEECAARWSHKFDYRIGVNSGEVVAAAYGSKRLGSFSVAGESVEFARRLCSANLIYGTRILVGPETYSLASDEIEVRPIELIRGKTPNSREEVYELMAMKNMLSAEDLQKRDLFWKGIVYYRERQWDEALEYFQGSLTMKEKDAPVEFYIRRIEQLRVGALPADWDNTRI